MGTTRDYYADLELPPSADVQDIKKQFRKLALKYHPDRNPGREQEVNSKFQIIQSAHEVLTDPQQKAKYDASLSRSGRGGQSANVKGNPWSHVSSQFPTPPRRNQGSRGGAAPPPSGAQRWQSRFSAGVPPTAKQQTSADAEAKKNAARAFEGMRKPSAHSNAKSSASAQAPPPPPRTETARQRQQAAFGNSRKSGYYPRSADLGDEPPVASKHYSSRSNHSPTESERPEGRKSRTASIPDPLSQFREREREPYVDPRQSTPYTTQGGEKTDPFDGVPISRAKSQREPPRRGDHLDPNPPQSSSHKYRSSSVPRSNTKDASHEPNLDIPRDNNRPHTSSEASSQKPQASFENAGQAGRTSPPSAPGVQTAMPPRPDQQSPALDPGMSSRAQASRARRY
jgi:curved DNA-binding protein CbpA